MILKRAIVILLSVFSVLSVFSQNDSCSLKISLLTCGPGEDLYSIWGHTAIRVKVKNSGADIIFNYGTFDFEDPDFYKKFTLGKLLYYVSAEDFQQFMYEYQMENRSVIEQDLNLSCEEQQRLFDALRTNAQEENKYYQYEFLFDNCSTRPRDIITKNNDDSVRFKRIIPLDAPTFRNMIHVNLDQSKQYWSKFGIDLVLASRIDRKVKNEEAMFLPDYLMKGFDSAVANNKGLVLNKRVILQNVPVEVQSKSILTPLFTTLGLLAIGILITFGRYSWSKKAADIFDVGYFLLLGLMGCFMLFMWFGTDHELCRDNYNILWAFPPHLVMSFFVLKKTRFTRIYFAVTAAIALLVVVSWKLLPQELNIAFLPLILLAGLRASQRAMKK
ncbi:MAG: DUF4105 domain-containing protein [Chitinophagaceae bacterium]|nr:DUF4105 domain-containing protein [Chitinophagaceae bacterium]